MNDGVSPAVHILVISTFPYPRDANTSIFVKDLLKHSPAGFTFTVIAPVPVLPWERGYREGALAQCREKLLRELPNVREIKYVPYRALPRVLLPLSGFDLARTVEFALRDEVSSGDFSCIHAHSLFPEGWVALRLGRKLRIPYMCTAHGSDVYRLSRRWYLKGLISKIVAESGSVVFVSGALLKEAARLFPDLGQKAKRVAVIPDGIDASAIRRALTGLLRPEDEKLWRTMVSRGGPVIVWVGGLRRTKQPDVALRVFQLVLTRIPNASMVFIGDGPMRDTLSRQIAKRKLSEQVVLLGTRPHQECLTWMSKADVLLITSRYEGFSLVALEALALGTLVVGPRVGVLGDLAEEKSVVILDDVEEARMAQAVVEALERQRPKVALTSTVLNYDWKAVAERMAREYDLVCSGGRGGR